MFENKSDNRGYFLCGSSSIFTYSNLALQVLPKQFFCVIFEMLQYSDRKESLFKDIPVDRRVQAKISDSVHAAHAL